MNCHTTGAPAPLYRAIVISQWHFPDQNCFLLAFGAPVGWNWKVAHPYDFISTHDHRTAQTRMKKFVRIILRYLTLWTDTQRLDYYPQFRHGDAPRNSQ